MLNKEMQILCFRDLESTRDFLDIEDCIDALLVLSNLGTIGEVYNICSGA